MNRIQYIKYLAKEYRELEEEREELQDILDICKLSDQDIKEIDHDLAMIDSEIFDITLEMRGAAPSKYMIEKYNLHDILALD